MALLRGRTAAAVVVVCALTALPARAQPHGWFASPDRLTVLNLSTGITVLEQRTPTGVRLGAGDIDPSTGDYFAITDVGTFRVRLSPPAVDPRVLPIAGRRLRISPDGVMGLIQDLQRASDWMLVRMSDGADLARYQDVYDAHFDPTGILMVTGAAPYRIHRYALASPATALWTLEVPTLPRVAGNASRTVVFVGTSLRTVDPATGSPIHEIAVPFVVELVLRGNHLYLSHFSELAKYDVATLERVMHTASSFPTSQTLQVSADDRYGYAYSSNFVGRTGYISSLVTFDTSDMRVVTRRLPPANAQMVISRDPVCPFEIQPLPSSLPNWVPAAARGGVLQFTVTTEARCGPWMTDLVSGHWGGFGRVLIGPTTRVGSSNVLVAVPPRNADVAYRPEPGGIRVGGVSYTIDQLLETAVPEVPVDVRVRQSASDLILEWSVDEGPDITGFRIEGGVAGGPILFTTTAPPSARSLTVASPPPGTYFVQVRAVNAIGVSPASAPPTAVVVGPTQPPAAPTNLRVDVRASYLRLDWDVSSSSSASHFVIEGGAAGGGRTVLARTSDTRPTLALTNIQPGQWQFAVRAINDSGTSAASNVVTAVTTTCSGPPTPPASFRAIVTENVVTVSWNVPSTGADSVVIAAGTVPGASDLGELTIPASMTRIDQAVPAGAYVLRLRARNACGSSPPTVERIIAVR